MKRTTVTATLVRIREGEIIPADTLVLRYRDGIVTEDEDAAEYRILIQIGSKKSWAKNSDVYS